LSTREHRVVVDDARDRRRTPRIPTFIDVDYRTDGTFLFASIGDISTLGIFLCTGDPLPQGTRLQLHFAAPGVLGAAASDAFELLGEVVWTTRDAERSGMGVRFLAVEPSDHVRLLELVRAIAYVDAAGAN